MKKLKIWLKIDIVGELALRHVNLLFQKTTADDDDECIISEERFVLELPTSRAMLGSCSILTCMMRSPSAIPELFCNVLVLKY